MTKDQILESLRSAVKLQRAEANRLQKEFGIDDLKMTEFVIPWWMRRLDPTLVSPTWLDVEIALNDPSSDVKSDG